MTIIFIALAAFASTLLGGLFALQIKDKLHLVLGFSAGAVIAVAFFDLLPEAIELGGTTFPPRLITSIVALGFIVYTILDRFVILHSHHHEDEEISTHQSANKRGILGAGSLSIHSFLDGVAIGLAFQVSAAVGSIVTIAVLVHDFSDGINTVNLISKNGGTKRESFKWLLVDAIAPVLGIISTLFFTLDEGALGIVLATFCGFFLYIGATDLLPESHHNHPTKWTTIMTILGMAILYGAIRIIG